MALGPYRAHIGVVARRLQRLVGDHPRHGAERAYLEAFFAAPHPALVRRSGLGERFSHEWQLYAAGARSAEPTFVLLYARHPGVHVRITLDGNVCCVRYTPYPPGRGPRTGPDMAGLLWRALVESE